MKRLEVKRNIAEEANFMIINSIEIRGYRNLQHIKLDISKIASLVAPNGYGKSNVLDAIKFGIDFIIKPPKTRNKMMRFKPAIPISRHMDKCVCQFVFHMQDNSSTYPRFAEYSFSFAWQNDQGTGGKILTEILRLKNVEKNESKFSTFISRDEKNAKYKTSQTGRCNNNITVNTNELVLSKLSIIGDLFYSETINKIAELTFYIEDRMDIYNNYDIVALRRNNFIRDSLDIEDMDDIPRYIYFLKKNYPDKYEQLEYAFKLLFPNFTDILTSESEFKTDKPLPVTTELPFFIDEKVYKLELMDINLIHQIHFDYLSNGTKRIFALLVALLAADINNISLIALEEIETSIHPALMKSFINIIEQFAGDTRIIFTSHSPYIIDYLEPHEIYLPIPNNKGLAEFANVSNTRKANKLIKDASAYDTTLGGYIFSLLSGDEDDFIKMRSYLGG